MRRNLVPALLFLQGLFANSQNEDMCPSRAVVRPVLNLTLQLICCNVQGSIAKCQVEDLCPSRAVVRPVSNLTLKLIARNIPDTQVVIGLCPSGYS